MAGSNLRIQNYFQITLVSVDIALCAGAINRYETADEALVKADKALTDSGLTDPELSRLEWWIRSLPIEDRQLLADGDQEEIAELVAESPTAFDGSKLAQVFEQIYEAVVA